MLTWSEWQERLIKAFPSESNYGALLTDMLNRRLKFGEPIDEYYFDKLSLLRACEISGKRAVDCLIYGIDDRMIRASASSARFINPEDLLKFLKDLCRESNFGLGRKTGVTAPSTDFCRKCNQIGHRGAQCRSSTVELTCYNCKEKGHIFNKCPKPLVRCNICNRIGHIASNCTFGPPDSLGSKKITDKKIMMTKITNTDAKYFKDIVINGNINTKCYIDFGSECTIVRQDVCTSNFIPIDYNTINLPVLRGFGQGTCVPVGRCNINIQIGEVAAEINALVVDDSQLFTPILIGQDFTERRDILVIKTSDTLNIVKQDVELPFIDLPDTNKQTKVVLKIMSDTTVDTLNFVQCFDENKRNSPILIESTVRSIGPIDYYVIGGVYGMQEGLCQIAIGNLSKTSLTLKSKTNLVRAEIVKEYSASNNCYVNKISRSSDLPAILSHDVNINKKITSDQKDAILKLINRYRNCFAQNLSELGCTNVSEMEIKLSDQTPIAYRPYRLSHSEREKVREMVQELLDNDIVEESNSPYASPIILVSKKTGGSRLCVDFRALNRKTIKDHFPMPRIDDQLDLLNGNKFFSGLDLASGYYQIPMKEESRHLTAFITPDGLYQFKKMPFGLVNSPSVFQRTINRVLGNARFHSALAYMDDILIPSKTFEEGLERLENVFQLLQNSGLTLNINKCSFFQENLEYLGYEISEMGIRPGKLKINAVENFPTPSNVHEIRQFIGLASYFRKFIHNFAMIARPLTDLTRKNSSWHWGPEQENSFRELKQHLIQRPLLGIYDPKKPTYLHTDASKYGLAGILMQKDNDSSPLKPIAYFSRKTSVDEQTYHAYELETLAVVASLQRFRVYLLGIKFTLVTDCIALRASLTKRDLIPRVARWWIVLQEYDFEIQYKPGCTLSHVDALSRNPQPNILEESPNAIISVYNITQEDWLLSMQLNDPELKRIRNILENDQLSDVIEIKQNYILKNNRLYKKHNDTLKWVVPKCARFQLCKLNHDEIGHFSIEKTLNKIQKDFWFPKMKRFITKYVKSCIECAYSKEPSGPKEGHLHPIHKIDKPFDTVHIDHLGPFVKSSKGYCYLLVLVDGFTKFCLLKPIRNLKSKLSIAVLEDIFSTFGYPNRLISDQGTSFTSREFKEFCCSANVRHILNAVSSPRANGQVERYNRTILDALTAYTDKLGERNWDKVLGKLQWGLNNTLNKGIGKTPSEALFGIQMTGKADNIFAEILSETRSIDDVHEIRNKITEHIEQDQEKQKERYDKRHIAAKIYKVGDLVKILKPIAHNDGKSKKLLPKFSGPYKITKVLENDRYEVSSIEGSNITQKNYCNIWAADRIKPWITAIVNNDSSESENSIDTDN